MDKEIVYNFINGLKGSYLEAYCGLRRVRETNGEKPDDCPYVRLTYSKFLDEELSVFSKRVSELNSMLNGDNIC